MDRKEWLLDRLASLLGLPAKAEWLADLDARVSKLEDRLEERSILKLDDRLLYLEDHVRDLGPEFRTYKPIVDSELRRIKEDVKTIKAKVARWK